MQTEPDRQELDLLEEVDAHLARDDVLRIASPGRGRADGGAEDCAGREQHREVRPVQPFVARETPPILGRIALLDGIKRFFGGAKADAEAAAEGEEPVATAQGDDDRETSTNAQMSGASDEPRSGRE